MGPFAEQLAAALRSRVPVPAARGSDVREAAVAVLVRQLDEPEILFIKRAERLGDPWSGQIAFPGGRQHPNDKDLADTARRETHEEIGLDPDAHGQRLGALDEVEPGTRRLPPLIIAPFVWSVPADVQLAPSPLEVQAAIWVGLGALRAPENVLSFDYGSRTFPALQLGPYVLWGLTYRIVESLLVAAPRVG